MIKPSRTEWSRLAQLKDGEIDTTDISALTEKFFRQAELRLPFKQAVTIQLDPVYRPDPMIKPTVSS
ncbi:TPA: hypothetical protein QEM55_005070 [Pseudomonas putida]|nr:hypothetical protein [Pseudomonas sp. BP8]MBP2261048.1 hypothetical protein [Pseudomonas sp. BP8]HDS1737979.1 hypothetical protein [Pseudomonas putida]